MSDLEILEIVLRATGFVVAALGSCAAVPTATWRLINRVETTARDLKQQLSDRLHHRTARDASGSATAMSVAIVSDSSGITDMVTISGGSVEDRLTRLEGRLDEAEQRQRETAAGLSQEVTERTRGDAELRAGIKTEVTRLDRVLEEREEASEKVDAAALPIILGGAAVSTFPDFFAHWAVLGSLALCVSIGLFFYAWVLLDRARSRSTQPPD